MKCFSFNLRPRNGLSIVEELPKNDRKGLSFGKKWQERYVFVTLLGSHYRWNFVGKKRQTIYFKHQQRVYLILFRTGGTHPARAGGESNVARTRALPLERRQVIRLVKHQVLCRSLLWHGRRRRGGPNDRLQEGCGYDLGEEGAIDRIASDDEFMITGSRRRVVVTAGATSLSQERKSRGGVTTRSAQQSSGAERTYDGFSGVLADLNAKVFPQDQTLLPDEDPSEVIRTLQDGLLRTLSQLHHLGDRLLEGNPSSDWEEKDELSRKLSEEKSKRVAKELELRDLQTKVKVIEGSVEISSAEALKLSREKQELGEALAKLKAEVEASEDMRVMAVNGKKITTRWEIMREWLNGQARKWDLATEFDQFKTVVLAEEKFKGVDPPSFEHEPVIPPFLDMDADPPA
ncbi:hypothetical protein Bca4012_063801 [Brassica carinata]